MQALHPTVTACDAAYVALAEGLGVPLVTLDRRLARADGPACSFLLPPDSGDQDGRRQSGTRSST